MDIPEEWMQELSAQERAVLYLGEALHDLMDYVKSEYVFTKVDLAFVTEKGLVIYSYNNGVEVNQYLVDQKGSQHFIYSPGVENPAGAELFQSPTKEQIYKIFRKWEADEEEEYPRTMLSKLEYFGKFDETTKVYGVAIGFANSVLNKEVIQVLFSEMVKEVRNRITRRHLDQLQKIDPKVSFSQITKAAAIRILADRFYEDERETKGEELYETLCLLSCAPYEKSQNRGRIGIASPTIRRSEAFIHFQNPIEICKRNTREIRKLLE